MKKTLVILTSLLLSGCAITIDEAMPTDTTEVKAQPASIVELNNENEDVILLHTGNLDNQIVQPIKSIFAKPIHYIALGDSLTRGVGDELDNYGFTGVLADTLEMWPEITAVELDNRGKDGRRSDQLLSLVKRGHYDEEFARTDLVTISLGGNDVMKIVKGSLFQLDESLFKKEQPAFVARYNEIVSLIRAQTNAPIIFVGFYNPFSIITDDDTPFEAIIHEWNNEIERISASTSNACFAPMEDLFVSNEELVYHTDFFHPNANGYERMANRVIDSMIACDIEGMTEGKIGFQKELIDE